ncbi:MAG: hypothetical protein LUH50_13305 [Bacteroides intestinalis]|nr:hypothetical protein [Bacteroides intestinalis]
MKKPKMMTQEVFDTLNQIRTKNIGQSLYKCVYKHEAEFLKMGVSLEDISDLLQMKQNAEEYPEAESYQVYDQWRELYIYDNFTDPEIKLRGDNERAFLAAVLNCDSWRIDYVQKADELAKTVISGFEELWKQEETLAHEGWRSWNGIKYQLGRIAENMKMFVSGDVDEGISQTTELLKKQGQAVNDERIRGEEQIVGRQMNMPRAGEIMGGVSPVEKTAKDDKLYVMADEEKIASDGVTVLHRIKASRDLYIDYGIEVAKGQPGGWIESEKNLEGRSWVGGNAEVYGKARIINSALTDNGVVKGNAVIRNSCVTDDARVLDNASVESSLVCDRAEVSGDSVIKTVVMSEHSRISGASQVENCSCCMNTNIIDSTVSHADFVGDILIDSLNLSYGRSLQERGSFNSDSPLLLDELTLEELRSNLKVGLKNVELAEADGKKLVADLKLVKGENIVMELCASNPVIHFEGMEYDGQDLIDTLEVLYSGMENVSPKNLHEILSDLPEEFLVKGIVQKIDPDLAEGRESDLKAGTAVENHIGAPEGKDVPEGKTVDDDNTAGIGDRLWGFTGEKKLASDQVTLLQQIRADKQYSFVNAKDIPAGTTGGWIESEKNLDAYSWVGDNAEVYGDAKLVSSYILDSSVVRDSAMVERSVIAGKALITGEARINESYIAGQGRVGDNVILKSSVVDGYSSVGGGSYLNNSFCLQNTHVSDSVLNNVLFDGDFEVSVKELYYRKKPGEVKAFENSVSSLVTDAMLDELRANQGAGLREVSLCNTKERELIADLNLVKGDDMEMNVTVSNPVIKENGVRYDGERVVSTLKNAGHDIANMEPDKLSAMLTGKLMLLGKQGYMIEQDKDGFKLANVKKRVSDIEIYSHKAGGMAIRCMIDGVQQLSKMLTAEDLRSFDDKTERKALAVRYFAEEFRHEGEMEYSMRR